jgi:hypothetical protein
MRLEGNNLPNCLVGGAKLVYLPAIEGKVSYDVRKTPLQTPKTLLSLLPNQINMDISQFFASCLGKTRRSLAGRSSFLTSKKRKK